MKTIYYSFFGLLFLLLCSACTKDELSDLSYNPLDDPDTELFELVEVIFEPYSSLESNVRLVFDSKYDELLPEQRALITKIQVTGELVTQFDPTRNFFFDPIKTKGENVCYALAFKAGEGNFSKKTTFCFEVE